MRLGKITSSWKGLGAMFLILIIALGLWVFWTQRETKRAAALTPEMVVEAFQATGLKIYDVQEMQKYTVPLAPGERGISFSADTINKTVRVYVVLYPSVQEANRIKISINDFNKLMNNQCGYGFRRGSVVLLVGTTERSIVRQFKAIFMSVQ